MALNESEKERRPISDATFSGVVILIWWLVGCYLAGPLAATLGTSPFLLLPFVMSPGFWGSSGPPN